LGENDQRVDRLCTGRGRQVRLTRFFGQDKTGEVTARGKVKPRGGWFWKGDGDGGKETLRGEQRTSAVGSETYDDQRGHGDA